MKKKKQSLWAESNTLEALCLRRSPARAQRFFLQCIDLSEFTATFSAANRRMCFFSTNLVPTERKGPECVSMTVCHHAAWWQVATQSVNKRQAIPRGDDVIGTSVSTGGRAERDQAVPSGWKGRNNRFAMFFTVLCLVFSFVFASNWFLKPGH